MNTMAKNKRKPLSFWSWNSELTEEEICAQIQDFRLEGYGGFFIHARAGLRIPYMGEKWLEFCQIACEEGKRCELDVYLYDEDGWPSGFGGGTVPALGNDYRLKGLLFSHGTPMVDECQIISAYRLISTNRYKRIPLGQADQTCLFAYYIVNIHYVDIASKKVTKRFIESTHEIYKHKLGQYFGSVIKGIFTDEPQLFSKGYHWSFELEDYYFKLTGRILLDDLWLLYIPGDGYEQILHDFWYTLSCMVKENYSGILALWCNDNKIALTGHFALEEGMCGQIATNGGVMNQYEKFDILGIDHLGRRFAPLALMKQPQSIAGQMGIVQILSETFGCSGWDISFADMTRIWGWQAVNGINLPCLHLSAYSIAGRAKRDYPAFYSYQEPWWKKFYVISEWMKTINTFMGDCDRNPGVLIIPPLSGLWCLYRFPQPIECQRIASEFRSCIENLAEIQVDFDIGDENMIARYGKVLDGRLHINKKSYHLVIVSETISIEESTLLHLEEFIKQGGKLMFVNKLPTMCGGIKSGRPASLCTLPDMIMINRLGALNKFFDYHHWIREVELRSHNNRYLANDFLVFSGNYNNKKRVGIWNGNEDVNERHVLLQVPGKNRVFQIDPFTTKQIEHFGTFNKGKTSIPITLYHGQTALFEVENSHDIEVKQDKQLPIKTTYIQEFDVSLQDLNSLTLDYVSYSLNGSLFSDEKPLIHIHNDLYDQMADSSDTSEVKVRYKFYNNLPSGYSLMVALENNGVEFVSVNGYPMDMKEIGWYIDKNIIKYDITNIVQHGLNIVELNYRIDYHTKLSIKAEFETESNRFYYPIEFENIYIIGDFDVSVKDGWVQNADHIRCSNPSFCLAYPKKKISGELTSQGLWFYSGQAVFATEIPKNPKECRTVISFYGLHATMLEVFVNDNDEGIAVFTAPFQIDVSDLLNEESNRIKIILYGHNRNLLGPHHHYKGQNYFVGPSTFMGEHGWEDDFTPDVSQNKTWTDDYSFVPFGMDGIKYTVYKSVKIWREDTE